jgi:hypothetical protein
LRRTWFSWRNPASPAKAWGIPGFRRRSNIEPERITTGEKRIFNEREVGLLRRIKGALH